MVLASVLCSERKWLGEFGFSTMLTDEAAENERNTLSLGHIWLSPQLQPCYTGRNQSASRPKRAGGVEWPAPMRGWTIGRGVPSTALPEKFFL